jgi:2-desacetyl-2-hydroxyethyl bacteriochlorophyllide A dehydrogenase
MRAAVVRQYKEPWVIEERPTPKPGPGQVRIDIEASGMCGTDIHVHHGYLPTQPPFVAGHEPVGKIAEVGEHVHGLKVGDRVGVFWIQQGCGRCRACQIGRTLYCQEQRSWMTEGGGNAESMIAWADGCAIVPDGVSPIEAAPIFCAGYTVMSGLRNAEPRPGDRVAVIGIGGLGHIAVQISKALGLETIAVTGNESKTKEAKELGADEVVVSGDDAGKALMAIGGVDIVLSTSNSAAQVTQVIGGLRPEGRAVIMGFTDGPVVVGDLFGFMLMQKRLIGSTQNRRSDLIESLELLAAGKVKPRIEQYPLDKVNEARDRLAAGKVRYRAVITPR